MKTLADLLQKFKALRDPAEDKTIIAGVIKSLCGIDIPHNALTLKDNKIYIKTHPALRNVLYIKKKDLLIRIQESLPDQQSFMDIV